MAKGTASDIESRHREAIRDYVADVMIEKGWNQGALAKSAGLDPATISRAIAKSHTTNMRNLMKIANASGIELSEAVLSTAVEGVRPKPGPDLIEDLRSVTSAAPREATIDALEKLLAEIKAKA